MEDNRAGIAALIFVLLIAGVNVMMYGIVRGVMRGGKNGPFETMMKAINPAQKKKDDDMEELRRTVQELNNDKDKDNPNGEPE